jgi:HEAT repeat protein
MNVQFMVKDSKKYAASGGWGFADFKDGKPGNNALIETCFSTLLGILGKSECNTALRAGLSSPDRRTSRACYRVVAEMHSPDAEPLLDDLLRSGDPLLRFHASKRLLQSVEPVKLPRLYTVCKRDPYMPVRRAALDAVISRTPSSAYVYLPEALLDRHSAVRDLARFHLQKRGNFDPRSFYRSSIATEEGPRLISAIYGLGEIGNAEDFEVLHPLLSTEKIALRKAVLLAGARLKPETMIPILLAALADSSPGISKAAQRSLNRHMHLVSGIDLAPLLEKDKPAHVRRNALGLVLQLSKWNRLALALQLCADEDPKLASLAQAGVSAWWRSYNRSSLSPSVVQLEAIPQALEKANKSIGKKLYDELHGILAHWQQQ